MPDQDQIVAIGFLTERDLSLLGQSFNRAYPVSVDHGAFDDLLHAIEAASANHRDGFEN